MASAKGAEIASQSKAAALFRERDVWLNSAKFPQDVVKEAKEVPFPIGVVDDQGKFNPPCFLGDKFAEILTKKYKSRKYVDKVAPVVKRSASSGNPQASKKFKSNKGFSSSRGSSGQKFSDKKQENQAF
jgi:hypothetical protein